MDPVFFPPVVRLHGDPAAAMSLRQDAMRELDTLRRLNVCGLSEVSRTVRFDDGRAIVCAITGGRETAHLYAPAVRSRRHASPVAGGRRRHERDDSAVFVIPGCVARYDGTGDLQNALPDGALSGARLGLGARTATLPFEQTGLPSPGLVPEAGLSRSFDAFELPGGQGSGILYGAGHIPSCGAFSISCLFRLKASLAYDYTFDERGVLSPIRCHVLQSADGEDFTWSCPGSLSPVAGYCQPHFHPGWSETVTYPWSPWNEDFENRTQLLHGVRRVEQSCPDAPLLASAEDGAKAYTDAKGHAYPHPHGFVAGMRLAGLFIADGDRLMAGRIADFSSEIGLSPILTPSIPLGVWRHAVLSHAADGATTLYLAAADQKPWRRDVWRTRQGVSDLDMSQGYAASGVNSGALVSQDTGETISSFRMNAALDVALIRFFHHALDDDQAGLLHDEAFNGEYAADEFEIGLIEAAGLTPIVIGRRAP